MRWLLLLPLLVVLILFGLSNRQEVALGLWPFDVAWVVPLSVAMLVFGALAFLFGALVAWLGALQYRRRARRLEEAARVLEAELADLRARTAREVGPVPPVAGAGTGVVRLHRPAA
ncbi:lipopolysaccharide assembly protein LapA domain-containing protein [Crenalkalicoccus roseus]|uniref:lipopolysaccharide assembly protein LapA domain-containing protein n=1 Tax=Crenalkalicoccus roseus TaxID=1485588 RepID=UPI001EFFBB46|nr:lipopolysaccharide assembly protein LapA domain-containing protein [Crenalkalicoccus roseus]